MIRIKPTINISKICSFFILFNLLFSCSKNDESNSEPTFFKVTISIEGEGSTNISSENYIQGDTIRLMATPDQGYAFVEWLGLSSTNPNLTLTVNSNINATAVFEPIEEPTIFQVTISIEGEGSTNISSENYIQGDTIRLMATPDQGYAFVEWLGLSSNNPDLTITVNSNINTTAVFELIRGSRSNPFTIEAFLPNGFTDHHTRLYQALDLLEQQYLIYDMYLFAVENGFFNTYGKYFNDWIFENGLVNTIGNNEGIHIYQLDSFYSVDGNITETHGWRVYQTLIKHSSDIQKTIYQISGNILQAIKSAQRDSLTNIITTSATALTSDADYTQELIDRVEAFENQNTLLVSSLENQGDDGQEYTHGVVAQEIVSSGNGLEHSIFVGSYELNGSIYQGNVDSDHLSLFLENTIFVPEISTSHATPKLSGLASTFLSENPNMSAVELKNKIFSLTRKQDIVVLRAEWDSSINDWEIFEYYTVNVNLLDEATFAKN